MPTFQDLLTEFPAESQKRLLDMWMALPAPMQEEMQGTLKRLPGDSALWKMLLNMALAQYKIAFGDKQTVAIVGPANVGKSTLYNQFVRAKTDRAEVSPIPGTTRVNQTADAGLFSLTDTPGADAAGATGEAEKQRALEAAQAADFLIVMFDATQGIKRDEQALFHEFAALDRPMLVALNKIDLARRDEARVIGHVAAKLELDPSQIVPISAKDGRNMERILNAIAKAEPGIIVALARALPHYRWRLAWTAITGAASTSAVIALTPLPIIDFVPLIAVQTAMVLSIARIYQYDITPARARELIAAFGIGFLARTVFQELSKLGGPPGWLLSAAIAASTTVVMGYASIMWFERGEKLTAAKLNEITLSLTNYLLDTLKNLGQRKPSKESLQEQVKAALENAPLAQGGPEGENH
jgi:small GTP-binding protein